MSPGVDNLWGLSYIEDMSNTPRTAQDIILDGPDANTWTLSASAADVARVVLVARYDAIRAARKDNGNALHNKTISEYGFDQTEERLWAELVQVKAAIRELEGAEFVKEDQ